jgi:hypothetical protein
MLRVYPGERRATRVRFEPYAAKETFKFSCTYCFVATVVPDAEEGLKQFVKITRE